MRSTRTITVESIVRAGADRVWDALRYPGTFLYVTRGLLGFPSLVGRTAPFELGEADSGMLMLFHVLPLSRHHIHLVEMDPATMTMRTEERGGLIRSWQHTLHVEAIDARSCRYTDTVVVDAGPFTAALAVSAEWLFRYRHLRWARLARRQLS